MSHVDITPRQFAEQNWRKWRDKYLRSGNDGPVVGLIKRFFGMWIWHWLIERYVEGWLARENCLDTMMPPSEAKATFNKAVEWFWCWWTVALVIAYLIAYAAAGAGPFSPTESCLGVVRGAILFLVGFICTFRVLEILVVSFRLHVLEFYETSSPAHAIVLTFVAFFQVMLAFAVLYLAAAFFTGDPFDDTERIWSNWLNAAYFSTVTIATLGYGDFAPTLWLGKLLVIAEVFVGLLLIVVVFQRTIAATANQPNRP
jgi:voltage-gated potassium channel Kch